MGRGMSGVGFFPGIFRTENQQVGALTGVIVAAGTLYYVAFNLSGAPHTSAPLSPSAPNAPRRLSGHPADRARHSSPHLCSRVRAAAPLLRSQAQAAEHLRSSVDPGNPSPNPHANPG